MMVDGYLRTKDLADAVQVSVQLVRNYEAEGFLPVAERGANGYRRYTRRHLEALRTTRLLMHGYGWQGTLRIMQAVHAGNLADALAQIDERHAELDRTRRQLAQTLSTLTVLTAQLPAVAHTRAAQRLRVGEAAQEVGVPVSSLRFWEQQGLLHPVRERGSNYRLYDERQLRRLRIIVLLRQENYDFAAIHATLDELEAGRPERALAAVEERRNELARIGWSCAEGVAALVGYVGAWVMRNT
ncbi:MAG: MerR family transcriptional regulator [Caldilineaceae bacterium]